jgi:hypothetical protein
MDINVDAIDGSNEWKYSCWQCCYTEILTNDIGLLPEGW